MKALWLMVVFSAFIGCTSKTEYGGVDRGETIGECDVQQRVSPEFDRAMGIASDYLSANHPGMSVKGLCVSVWEDAGAWRVDYSPPPGAIGGGPHFRIGKKSLQVIDFWVDQ